jgi:hypothetical protein
MIFLDNIERKYLIDLLEKQHSKFWVPNKILEKVRGDVERLDKVSVCKHKYGLQRSKCFQSIIKY